MPLLYIYIRIYINHRRQPRCQYMVNPIFENFDINDFQLDSRVVCMCMCHLRAKVCILQFYNLQLHMYMYWHFAFQLRLMCVICISTKIRGDPRWTLCMRMHVHVRHVSCVVHICVWVWLVDVLNKIMIFYLNLHVWYRVSKPITFLTLTEITFLIWFLRYH